MNIEIKNLIKIRIQLKAKLYIGPGKILLLEKISKTGSISKAANEIGLSYRKAWRLIDELNKASLRMLVIAKSGGKGVRGSQLTSEGKEFIRIFRKIEKKLQILTDKEKKDLEKLFGKIWLLMLSNKYKTVLVTGASSGIGEAVVKLLIKKGYEVTALARRKSKLTKLAKETGCKTIVMDIRNTKDIETLRKKKYDVLINNAGLGRGFDKIYKTNRKDISTTIDTHVVAFLQLLRCITPNMVKEKKGHIVNIGSIAGLYPLSSSVYGGSKGAVHLISQNLRIELSGTGVRCTEINPGRVDTEFFDIAFDSKKDALKMKSGLTMLTPMDIANSILFAVEAPAHVNISSIEVVPTEQAPGGVKIERVL